MKRLLHTIATLFFILALLFANPNTVLASEGDGEQALALEVNGYHITISNQGEWTKGENTIVVTLTDGMGMPIRNADVEILIASNSSSGHAESEGHGEPEVDEHSESVSNGHTETDTHESEQEHTSMPEMHGEESTTHTSNEPAHEAEETSPIQMMESEHGIYIAEAHLEASGQHEIQVMFHANGEMLQADFVIDVPGMSSKTIVLWSFVVVNVGLVISAGTLKKQAVPVKGGR
ncbi:MAG TPA: hypothetical protein VFR47_01820 [Anaerolineales bacterium]|nr:hypothetical protein [Anaerolineales bacterium]